MRGGEADSTAGHCGCKRKDTHGTVDDVWVQNVGCLVALCRGTPLFRTDCSVAAAGSLSLGQLRCEMNRIFYTMAVTL